MKNQSQCFIPAIGLGICLILTASSNATADTYSSANAHWEQWAYSIPTASNPMLDTTGAHCMVGQHGDTWYLAGYFSGAKKITRTCSIPADTKLFFPIYNYIIFNTPNVCGQDGTNIPATKLRQDSTYAVNGIKVSLTVDGKQITNLKRSKSSVFALTLPEDNVFDSVCTPNNVPGQVYSPAVDEGYYAALRPLKAGKHKLHFTAVNGRGLQQDITYDLTIVPVLKK